MSSLSEWIKLHIITEIVLLMYRYCQKIVFVIFYGDGIIKFHNVF